MDANSVYIFIKKPIKVIEKCSISLQTGKVVATKVNGMEKGRGKMNRAPIS